MKKAFAGIAVTLFATLAAGTSDAAYAEVIAITGATVAIGDGSEPITNGTVIVRDGRIVAAGGNLPLPAGVRRIDAMGKWVTPGIVAGFSYIGLQEVGSVDSADDRQASASPFHAAIDVAPAINPKATAVAIERAGGVTRAIVVPSATGSIFAGQGAVIDLGADPDPIMLPRAFQLVELGEEGAKGAGGSRASAQVMLRNALQEARDIAAGGHDRDGALLPRADAQALVPILRGKQYLMVHVERANDILGVLELKREFPGIKLVLVGAAEGWTVAARIAAANVPVIASALVDLPATFERVAATQSNVGRMRAAGVRIAIGTIDGMDAIQQRTAKQHAGNLVALARVPGATGLTWGQALEAITSAPAEAIGLGGEIGSLRPGRRADVVIWDGDPLENGTVPELVMIDGVEQPLDNRQTRLRDRYRPGDDAQLPKAYRP